MPDVSKEKALEHIDYVLLQEATLAQSTGSTNQRYEAVAEREALFAGAFHRLCPPNSPYSKMLDRLIGISLDEKRGILRALRAAYQGGWFQTFTELVHEELLSDFLGMAERLLADKLKDPAAMYVGGVLEDHLRSLCKKNGIALTYTDGRGVDHPKMIDRMNNDLKDAVYGPSYHKQVTAWAGIRNHAAHAEYDKYDHQQVELMLEGIRHFVSTYPA